MGKNKNKKKNKNTEEQHQPEENNNNHNNDNNNVDEAADETSNEQKTEKNEKNNKQNDGPIVLGVYLHCQGCVETVIKSLRGFDGVEEIEINTNDNQVTVKGKSADAVSVAERLKRKTGKHVEIISPVQKKQQQPEKKEEKKPEAPKVIEVVLKMHLHCEGCAKDVKHCIHKMEGVHTVNPDMETSLVTVKGAIDPKNLVAYISKKLGRHAEIVSTTNTNNNKKDGEQKEDHQKGEKKEKKDKDKDKNAGSVYPNVPPGLIYAPQLFSDENPNACSIS